MQKNLITIQDAQDWIRIHREQIMDNNGRQKYYAKLGLQKVKEPQPEKLVIENKYQNQDFELNFLTRKTEKEVRNNYINKLFAIGAIKVEPSKKHQTIIIFDWDDTLICTSFLSAFQFLELSQQARNLVGNLDQYAHKLINKALGYGSIFIITNAAKGWVEYSSKLYLPKTGQLLIRQNVKIISARSRFEGDYPGDYHRWKVEAFKGIKKNFDQDLITNLICIGDSNIQMEAAHSLAKQFKQTLVKTIKFRQNPKPEELIKQQELVFEKLQQIYANTKNLTIRLQRKQSQAT